VHSRDAALRALESIFASGFDNVSVDLLCGVPGQTLELLDGAIDALTAFPITHLSCYLLTLPPHHRMYRDLPNEDTQLAHLLHLDARMRALGFEHYEISNFARPGRRARHNLAYWKNADYLGLGPSAHSHSGGRRWKNVSSLHKYAEILDNDRLPIEWTEELTAEQKGLEAWMLALRLDEGFPAEWLQTPLQRGRSERFLAEGLLEPVGTGRLRLTPRGFALSDQVIAALAG
jgi:oxygen-independent coproporphyrinogen-3 oxidase